MGICSSLSVFIPLSVFTRIDPISPILAKFWNQKSCIYLVHNRFIKEFRIAILQKKKMQKDFTNRNMDKFILGKDLCEVVVLFPYSELHFRTYSHNNVPEAAEGSATRHPMFRTITPIKIFHI